jgi:hypothetical protein
MLVLLANSATVAAQKISERPRLDNQSKAGRRTIGQELQQHCWKVG